MKSMEHAVWQVQCHKRWGHHFTFYTVDRQFAECAWLRLIVIKESLGRGWDFRIRRVQSKPRTEGGDLVIGRKFVVSKWRTARRLSSQSPVSLSLDTWVSSRPVHQVGSLSFVYRKHLQATSRCACSCSCKRIFAVSLLLDKCLQS